MILRIGGFSPALSKGALMRKGYVVRLTVGESERLSEIVRQFKGAGQKVRRAQILLKADANGPGWTDRQVADAFGCRRQPVENVRRTLCERGFEQTLDGVKRQDPPTPTLLDGAQEAKIIAMRLGRPVTPTGPCGCRPGKSSSCASWNRSATKRSGAP